MCPDPVLGGRGESRTGRLRLGAVERGAVRFGLAVEERSSEAGAGACNIWSGEAVGDWKGKAWIGSGQAAQGKAVNGVSWKWQERAGWGRAEQHGRGMDCSGS